MLVPLSVRRYNAVYTHTNPAGYLDEIQPMRPHATTTLLAHPTILTLMAQCHLSISSNHVLQRGNRRLLAYTLPNRSRYLIVHVLIICLIKNTADIFDHLHDTRWMMNKLRKNSPTRSVMPMYQK